MVEDGHRPVGLTPIHGEFWGTDRRGEAGIHLARRSMRQGPDRRRVPGRPSSNSRCPRVGSPQGVERRRRSRASSRLRSPRSGRSFRRRNRGRASRRRKRMRRRRTVDLGPTDAGRGLPRPFPMPLHRSRHRPGPRRLVPRRPSAESPTRIRRPGHWVRRCSGCAHPQLVVVRSPHESALRRLVHLLEIRYP